MTYEIIVRPAADGFRAICPQIPGVSGAGSTPGSALDAALASLTAHLARHGAGPPALDVVRATLAGAGLA